MGMPSKLKNFALFVDGVSWAGEVPELTPPKLTRKMEEFRAGGMRTPVKVDLGTEALELEVTAGGWMKDALKQWGANGIGAVPLRFAGAVQNDDTGEWSKVEIFMRGRWEELDMGSAKAGDDTEFKAKATLSYYRLVWDDEDLIEIDATGLIEKIGGVDLTEKVRQILGI